MECIVGGLEIFIRLDPGDRLVESLAAIATQRSFSSAAIVSGVGMLNGVELGFFDVSLDDYRRTTFDGIFDLSVVIGNIVLRDGIYVPHVHVVFNDASYLTYSGHVIEATCHVTIEIFLSTTALALRRVKVAGCPATRIVAGDD